MPLPKRIGTAITSAPASSRPMSSTNPVTVTPSTAARSATRRSPPPTIRTRVEGSRARTRGSISLTRNRAASALGAYSSVPTKRIVGGSPGFERRAGWPGGVYPLGITTAFGTPSRRRSSSLQTTTLSTTPAIRCSRARQRLRFTSFNARDPQRWSSAARPRRSSPPFASAATLLDTSSHAPIFRSSRSSKSTMVGASMSPARGTYAWARPTHARS